MGRACHCRLYQPASCPAQDGHSPPHHTMPFGFLDWEEEEEEQGQEEEEEKEEEKEEGRKGGMRA